MSNPFRSPVAPTVLIVLIGLCVSALAWIDTAARVERAANAEFQTIASTKLTFLKEGFVDYDDQLRNYHGFIAGAAGRSLPAPITARCRIVALRRYVHLGRAGAHG